MRSIRTRLRRPSWLSRSVAVIIGLVIGLGGLGGAAGALLGELGAAGSAVHQDRGHLDAGRRHDDHFGRGGADRDGDDGVGAGGPGSTSPR
jgi:hypothetical protein